MIPEEKLDELLLQWEERAEAGSPATPAELCHDCPELLPELTARVECLRRLHWMDHLRADPGPAASPPLEPGGEPIPGYRLIQRIGRGGFGEVWQAQAPDGSAVALKFVPWGNAAAAVEWRSLELIQGVQHPNVLPTFNAWQTTDRLIIAMELADRTLMDRWRQALGQGFPGIPPDELLAYFQQAAAAIDYLNEKGIQHRDIKPQNLLLQGTTLKVGDLGLARRVARPMTGHTGSLTLAYAPPEFFDGHTSRHSDQYSLAVSYCQMRTGDLPFTGSTAHIVAGHLHRPPDLQRLPSAEQAVLARALAKDPEARWPSCGEFITTLATASIKSTSDPVTASLPSGRPAGFTRRHLLLLGAGTASLAGLATMAVLRHRTLSPAEAGLLLPFEEPLSSPNNVRAAAADSIDRHLVLSNRTIGPTLQHSHTGQVVRRLPATFGPCAALAPLGLPYALTGHDDATIILWDLRTGTEIRRFHGHTSSVSSVAFSPDGSRVLTGACDRTLRLWDRRTGAELACLTGHESIVTSASFDPTGRFALSASMDGTARVWDLESGRTLHTFAGHRSQVLAATFSLDGYLAITGSLDRTARVWDPQTGEQVHCFEGHEHGVKALLQMKSGALFTASGGVVSQWDLAQGRMLYRSPRLPSTIQSMAQLYREEHFHLLLATEEHGLHLWRLPT